MGEKKKVGKKGKKKGKKGKKEETKPEETGEWFKVLSISLCV